MEDRGNTEVAKGRNWRAEEGKQRRFSIGLYRVTTTDPTSDGTQSSWGQKTKAILPVGGGIRLRNQENWRRQQQGDQTVEAEWERGMRIGRAGQ